MNYVCAFAYLLLSVYHIYFQKRKWITKPLLAPAAALCHIFAARTPDVWSLVAFSLCCAGDTILLLKGSFAFKAGGSCFLCALLLFAWSFARKLPVNLRVCAASAAAFFLFFFIALKIAKHAAGSHKAGRLLWSVYLSFNALVCSLAFACAIFTPGARGWISFAGAALFFVSDCFLCQKLSHQSQSRHAVMLTYTAALFLIALGAAR